MPEPADYCWFVQTVAELSSVTAGQLQNTFASSTAGFEAALILAFDYVIWIAADPILTIGLFLVSLSLALDKIAAAAELALAFVEQLEVMGILIHFELHMKDLT